jgi:hypothetical protein
MKVPTLQTPVQFNPLRPPIYWTTLAKQEAFAFVFRSVFRGWRFL